MEGRAIKKTTYEVMVFTGGDHIAWLKRGQRQTSAPGTAMRTPEETPSKMRAALTGAYGDAAENIPLLTTSAGTAASGMGQ